MWAHIWISKKDKTKQLSINKVRWLGILVTLLFISNTLTTIPWWVPILANIFLKVIGRCLQGADGYLWNERKGQGRKQDIQCLWSTRLNTVKMAMIPNLTANSFQALSKSSLPFCSNWQAVPKIHMDMQGTQKIQKILEKEEQGGLTLLNFKTYRLILAKK